MSLLSAAKIFAWNTLKVTAGLRHPLRSRSMKLFPDLPLPTHLSFCYGFGSFGDMLYCTAYHSIIPGVSLICLHLFNLVYPTRSIFSPQLVYTCTKVNNERKIRHNVHKGNAVLVWMLVEHAKPCENYD